MKRKRRSGFTLIEVLLVIAILGVLAAFVVPSFMGQAEQAMVDVAQIQVSRSGPIAGALDLYRLAVGEYPSTEDGLRALSERPDSLDEDVRAQDRQEPGRSVGQERVPVSIPRGIQRGQL